MTPSLTVEELVRARSEILDLTALNPGVALDRPIRDPDVSGPGLALAGFFERFPADRVQVFGETEMKYLATLSDDVAEARVRDLFGHGMPAAFVSKGLQVADWFVEAATAHGVPLFRSSLPTREVFRIVAPWVEGGLAPSEALHGSLADVYGVGLLFTGDSGVGKSECVLDLVERGHRLVADDMVIAARRGRNVLIGRAHDRQGHHMEIRGIGIIDIQALFGIRAIRQQKRIEVVVNLALWSADTTYDRTGLQRGSRTILGVTLPEITIPLNPGKNVTVISEVVAMDHLLRYSGVDSAQAFDQRLRAAMAPVREYLEEDYE